MLILRLPRHWWSLPLVREKEDGGIRWRGSRCPSMGSPALSARQEQMEWNGMICLGSSSPSRSNLIPYITRYVGYMAVWVDESTVYMCQSPGGSCSGALWTMVVSRSQRSLGHLSAALF